MSAIEETDHQKILSTFTRRTIAAHSNGALFVNLPKSESNITYLSDGNPLITHNPVYDDSSPLGSPVVFAREENLNERRFAFSPSHSAGSGCAWSMPARIHGGLLSYDVWKRQGLMDQNMWELQFFQADAGGKQNLKSLDTPHPSDNTESKLSVREQARQFEQQGFQEGKQNRDSIGSLSSILIRDMDSDDILEMTSETLLSIMDNPHSPMSVGKDVPPSIIITETNDSQSPSNQRPTPPVLRKFSSQISSYMTVQPCQITVEIIPDPPENPPPPPPQHSRPPSPLTSPPSSPPSLPSSPPPPPRPTPSAPSRFDKPQGTSLSSPFPFRKPVAPPPPPPLPPPSPASDQPRPVIQFVPTALPPLSSLRPVSERKHPPPLTSVELGGGKKELKGILKNIQNLADIERSIANLYSQVDKNCKVPKFNKKPQATEELDCANKWQSSDPGDEQRSPKQIDTISEIQSESTSLNCAENGLTPSESAKELQPTSQLNTNSPEPAELSELNSSQSTVF